MVASGSSARTTRSLVRRHLALRADARRHQGLPLGPHRALERCVAAVETLLIVAGVELEPFPNIQAWLKRCAERPATAKGCSVPEPFDLDEKLKNADEISRKSREQFGFSKA